MMRDDNWLLSRLDYLWTNYFPAMPQRNRVFIKFGRYSRLRLGSIKMVKTTGASHITITRMFKNLKIPSEVVDHTIAHELCHYAHGFSSPNPRLHKYPHDGGVIKKEMEERNMGHLFQAYQKWIKTYRQELEEYYLVKGLNRKR